MEKTVALLNIRHLRTRLAEVADEATKRTILQLLVEEEAKLAALVKQSGKRRRSLS